MQEQVVVITPLGNLRDLSQLVGAFVEAQPMDDPLYKHEKYLGTIDEVKLNWAGTFVRFHAENGPTKLVGTKWIPLRKVTGFAHYETAKATA